MTQYTDLEIPPAPEVTPPVSSSVPPAKKSGCIKYGAIGCGVVLLLGTLFVTALFLFVFAMMRTSDPYKEAMRRAQQDARVVAKLGSPVEAGWFITGSINTSGSSGNADLEIPIHGARAKGSVHVVAKKEAGTWKYRLMRMTAEDGTQVDLIASQAIEQEY